jgi:hypothetical protein
VTDSTVQYSAVAYVRSSSSLRSSDCRPASEGNCCREDEIGEEKIGVDKLGEEKIGEDKIGEEKIGCDKKHGKG